MGPRCPICSKQTEPRPKNPAAPFCSPRCRQIDLGKWLDGDYRVPAEETDEADGTSGADETGGPSRGEPS